MVNCENCGKSFATVPQLRGHNMRCRTPQTVEVPQEAKPVEVVKKSNYKELPPPIVEFLEREIPNWLDKLEIGQEWRKDFGGYAIYVKVPKEFSTVWKEESRMVWDNRTRKVKIDNEGNDITEKIVIKDERWCSMKDMTEAMAWLKKVITNITQTAQQKGLQLPSARID